MASSCCFRALLIVSLLVWMPATFAASNPALNVVVITIDTLRADHLGCYGYKQIRTPNIDALAGDGARFERAYTAVPVTLPSHTYFKLYKTQIPVVEQAIETAALLLGTDKSRGYCLEMICADFLAGANLENEEPTGATAVHVTVLQIPA